MDKKKLISIIIPAYNEEESIGWVIEKIHQTFAPLDYKYEVLVIDDRSTDKTIDRAAEQGAKIIKRKTNGGSGASRRTGILNTKGEIIAMLDGDGSYDPADLPALIEMINEYDMVNGVREREMGTLKYLRGPAKFFIRKLAEFLSGHKIPDLNTGMKVFRRDIMLRYLWVIPDGFSCVTSMTLAFLVNGYSVGFCPIRYYKRIGKSKFHPIKDTARYLQTVLRMIVYFNPMKFFTPLSISLFTFGVMKTFYDRFYLLHKMRASDIVIVLTSFIFFFIGVVCDLIVSQSKQLAYLREYIISKEKTQKKDE